MGNLSAKIRQPHHIPIAIGPKPGLLFAISDPLGFHQVRIRQMKTRDKNTAPTLTRLTGGNAWQYGKTAGSDHDKD